MTDTAKIFGTDGIRSRVGHGYMTTDWLMRIAAAYAQVITTNYSQPTLIIARDTRSSGPLIDAILSTQLLRNALTIHDVGVVPTPVAYEYVTHKKYAGGVIISASHNPPLDNGLKIIAAGGGKCDEVLEQHVSTLVHTIIPHDLFVTCGERITVSIDEWYIARVQAFFGADFLRGVSVVLDVAHGATYRLAPQIFRLFGAEVFVLHGEPNGAFINVQCGATAPIRLQEAVVARGASIGFAFDGDGDRCIAVTRDGQVRDGDDLLALLADHPSYAHVPTIVGTVLTNSGLDEWLAARHKKVVRTPVGDRYVVQGLREHGGVLGGEQSGHIMMTDLADTGDGLLVALRVCELLVRTGEWHMPTFERVPHVLFNVPVTERSDLSCEPYASIIREAQALVSPGRLIVRYSGTEMLLRVMIEMRSRYVAQRVGQWLVEKILEEMRLCKRYDTAESSLDGYRLH